MNWLDPYRLAEIHRETYIAILKAWIPHGKKDDFARKCGITREYFSCLCALENQVEGKIPVHKRYPSPKLAKKIAKNLDAPIELKRFLVENMELAHVYAVKIKYNLYKKLDPVLVSTRLSQLEKEHQQATFGKNLSDVQLSYHILRDASEDLLQTIHPEKYPMTYAQICLYYHDAQCILNRPDKALLYAKLAQTVIESADSLEPKYTKEIRDNLEINAIRGEAVAYHNLKLDKLAPDILLNRAARTQAFKNLPSFWEPFVYRDLINSIIETPRFGFREVIKTIQKAVTLCEKNSDEVALFLVNESWLRALIRNDKIKSAHALLNKQLEQLPNSLKIGALHRALFFNSAAQLAFKVKDNSSWEIYITEAIQLMQKAGLKHQLTKVKLLYTKSLNPILNKLSISKNIYS